MPELFVTPAHVTSTAAEFLVGIAGAPFPAPPVVELGVGNRRVVVGVRDWQDVSSDSQRVHVARVRADQLRSDTKYVVRAAGDAGPLASFRTPPDSIGPKSSPFRILLGSCFSLQANSARRVSALFDHLWSKEDLRPAMNLWLGDQIYLDAPALHYATHVHTSAELRQRFLEKYVATWWERRGLRVALENACNYFIPDDHELWNNAPAPSVTAKDSWHDSSPAGPQGWLAEARSLYRSFQNPGAGCTIFDIGHLSFCLADTRFDRSAPPGRFMLDEDLQAILDWLGQERDGPCILALGQPVFAQAATRSGLGRKFSDYNLHNFGQMRELLRAVAHAANDVLLITGDVHYSRVAWCSLPAAARLTEIISSPLALVSAFAGLKWRKPPDRLRIKGADGLGAAQIDYDKRLQSYENSAMTLDIYVEGAATKARVRVWPTRACSAVHLPSYDNCIVISGTTA